MIKFRTMSTAADPYARKPDDASPEVTPLGRRLRHRALDEFPQLWNVVRGDMALIGPRPEMPFVVDGYGAVELRRLETKPGLTGLWQLSRVRDRAIEHHMEYDLFYVHNRSFGMDVWLLWRTGWFALTGRSTKIRLAVRRWERDPGWRRLVPDRSKAIPRRTGRRLSTTWGFAAAGALVVLVLPGVVVGTLARGDFTDARTAFLAAEASLRKVDVPGFEGGLDAAEASLSRAADRLSSWVVAPGRIVPGLAGNLAVARAMVAAGDELVAAGREGLPVLAGLPISGGRLVLPFADGALDLAPFDRAAGPAAEIQERIARAEHLVRDAGDGLLLPRVRRARDEVLRMLDDARRQADVASGAAFLIPRLFGADGRRTWVIGAENTAELRGRGGYMGALGTVEAEHGRVRLGRFTDTAGLPTPVPIYGVGTPAPEYTAHYRRLGAMAAWQNLTMSPSFPSGARMLLARLEAAGLPPATGLVSLDPTALSYLLDVVGPVDVEGIPEPLTATNVVDWTLNRLYFEYRTANEQRKDVLAQVAQAVWGRLIEGDGTDPAKLAEALSRAIAERHLVVYSSDPEEQALIERLGMAGEVSDAPGDYLLVLGQNLGENKMDYYLERDIDYEGRVQADGSLDARLAVTVRNTASAAAALPAYVAGPRPRIELGAGVARSYVTALVPAGAELGDVAVDGEFPAGVENRLELGRRLLAVPLDIPAGQERTIVFRYRVPGVLVDGRYELTLQNQATVRPDDVAVDVQIPRNTTVSALEGFAGGDTLQWNGPVPAEMRLSAGIQRSLPARLASRVFGFLKDPLISMAG
jgi:hypothetical protein